jgi:hypothetical protein
VPEARRALACWCDEIGVDLDPAYDALVLASELATSGVLQAGCREISMRAWVEDESLCLEVETTGAGTSSVGGDPYVDPLDSVGRKVVEDLSEKTNVSWDGPRRLVHCQISLA